MDKQRYVVTEHAGPKVAGQRVRKGMKLDLTDDEARDALLDRAIELDGPRKPAAKAAAQEAGGGQPATDQKTA